MKLINLPNIVTCGNLYCGCLSIYFGLSGQIGLACLFIIGGAIFDFLDGLCARAMHVSGPIGKELDSLADVVSFGIAPSVLCLHILGTHAVPFSWFPLLAFIMAAFSALRLAKFNIDERQHSSFIGLPTPAAALLCASLCCLIGQGRIGGLFLRVWFIPALSLVLCALLVSPVPMFAFKFGKEIESDTVTKMKRYAIVSICIIVLVLVVLFRMPWQSFIFGAFSIYIIANLIFAAFKI